MQDLGKSQKEMFSGREFPVLVLNQSFETCCSVIYIPLLTTILSLVQPPTKQFKHKADPLCGFFFFLKSKEYFISFALFPVLVYV